jgi:xanthine permease XanP
MMLEHFLGRARDRKIARPPGLAFGLDDHPPLPIAAGLALQHLAIQSIYFVLPALVASMMSRDPADATRFLCLSIFAAAFWQAFQIITRGPVGSGYPMPGTHTAATIGAYGLVSAAGGGFGAAGAMVMILGLIMIVLTFVLRRTRAILPNEVAGVVVMLIGVALMGLGVQRMGLLVTGDIAPDVVSLAVIFVSVAVMAGVALSRTRLSPFAVLIGAIVGIIMAEALGRGQPNGEAILAARPWFAVPQPWMPRFDQVTPGPLLAFALTIVALKATALGSLIVVQRGTDASWTLPDPRPLRRGLLANGLAVMLAGLIGAAAPGPATAAVGLSVATGTLARSIVWIGTAMLCLLAFLPKVVALFVLVPYPVQGAMLFYVSGFILAQGCQLVTARLLDTCRTLIVAFGLGAGLTVALAPHVFQRWVPVLASPLSFGAVVAFLANLVTLPLVRRTETLTLPVDDAAEKTLIEWFGDLGGRWAMKSQTVHVGDLALTEFLHILMNRETPSVTITAIRAEDRVELRLVWAGNALPKPNARPHYEDLLASDESMEAFAVWMATRQAQSFSQRAVAAGTEVTVMLDD